MLVLFDAKVIQSILPILINFIFLNKNWGSILRCIWGILRAAVCDKNKMQSFGEHIEQFILKIRWLTTTIIGGCLSELNNQKV